jgi:hypothetical protein
MPREEKDYLVLPVLRCSLMSLKSGHTLHWMASHSYHGQFIPTGWCIKAMVHLTMKHDLSIKVTHGWREMEWQEILENSRIFARRKNCVLWQNPSAISLQVRKPKSQFQTLWAVCCLTVGGLWTDSSCHVKWMTCVLVVCWWSKGCESQKNVGRKDTIIVPILNIRNL